MGKLIDLTGQRFGRLLVRERAGVAREKKAAWLCQCDCGAIKVACSRELRTGETQSCGCIRRERIGKLRRTHGHSRGTREYNSWQAAKERCYNPNNVKYVNYGGRGVAMSDLWRDDFARFLADMGACPAGHSIDRIDPDGHYEPGNCRWSNAEQQSNNRRCTVYVFVDGERMTAREAATRFGFAFNTVRQYRDQEVSRLPRHR